MHLALFVVVIGTTVAGRLRWHQHNADHRWQIALATFLLPPLCLMTTAGAVLFMGNNGQMLGHPVGNLGYLTAAGFFSLAVGQLGLSAWQGWRSLRTVRSLPQMTLEGYVCRQLDIEIPFAAQIGFWTPTLVVSRGLVETLTPQHLRAVLIHEQAHALHRDTFWFFCLGWLRQVTRWLPQTAGLWQELLLLRELRADAWAARRVDAILLAEALLTVVQHHAASSSPKMPDSFCAPFDAPEPSRLAERIAALIDQAEASERRSWVRAWTPYGIAAAALMPVLTIFLHR